MSKKKTEGITLIALIITIIVMLILIGVTINIAINGGLFEQAGDAARRQEEQTIYEHIIGMTVWNEDGTINMAETYLAVKNAFGENNISELAADGTFTVTGKHGEYKYRIKENEISIITSEEQGGESHLTVSATIKNRKINSATIEITLSSSFSDDEGKKYLCSVLNISENSTYEDIDLAYYNMFYVENEEDKLEEFSEIQEVAGGNYSGEEIFNLMFDDMTAGEVAADIFIYENESVLKINGETIDDTSGRRTINYKADRNGEYNIQVTIGEETATCKITVEGLNEKLGKYVRINGSDELWIVLYNDETHGVQLITANAIGSVTLGDYHTNSAKNNYNNAVEKLVNECKIQTEIETNIRNVGGPPVDPTTMNDTVIFNELEGFKPREGVSFEEYEGSVNGLKIGDTNYLEDYNQMQELGILKPDNSASYWLSSRNIRITTYNNYSAQDVYFSIQTYRDTGFLMVSILMVNATGNAMGQDHYPTCRCPSCNHCRFINF